MSQVQGYILRCAVHFSPIAWVRACVSANANIPGTAASDAAHSVLVCWQHMCVGVGVCACVDMGCGQPSTACDSWCERGTLVATSCSHQPGKMGHSRFACTLL